MYMCVCIYVSTYIILLILCISYVLAHLNILMRGGCVCEIYIIVVSIYIYFTCVCEIYTIVVWFSIYIISGKMYLSIYNIWYDIS